MKVICDHGECLWHDGGECCADTITLKLAESGEVECKTKEDKG